MVGPWCTVPVRFGADYLDPSPKDEDGTVLVAITAMDALDFRGEDSSLRRQMHVGLGRGALAGRFSTYG